MASGPVVAMVWEGLNAVKTGRVMLGETNPADSKPGTIRGDLCLQVSLSGVDELKEGGGVEGYASKLASCVVPPVMAKIEKMLPTVFISQFFSIERRRRPASLTTRNL